MKWIYCFFLIIFTGHSFSMERPLSEDISPCEIGEPGAELLIFAVSEYSNGEVVLWAGPSDVSKYPRVKESKTDQITYRGITMTKEAIFRCAGVR